MTHFQPLVHLIRGGQIESVHMGAAVICDAKGQIREAWGDPSQIILPRSSCKMIQALPLVEAGLVQDTERLALACASHSGQALHAQKAGDWLAELGLREGDLRCGAHMPLGPAARDALVAAGGQATQLHNNCSGKHVGFLAMNQHLGAGAEYHEIDHPLQRQIRATFEEVTGHDSPYWGIDGCSAPNFATPLKGLATAMARFATAGDGTARARAMAGLRQAMASHPDLVAGEGRACTELMQAMNGVAVKTGAEGVYTAILPDQGLGMALKIADGGTRAAEAVIAALLIRQGVLDPQSPVARRLTHGPIRNCNGLETGRIEVTL